MQATLGRSTGLHARCREVQLRPQLHAHPRLCMSRRPQLAAAASKQQFSSFDDMLAQSDVPVLVDFYANWCGPCQMLAPILASVSTKLKGRVKVVKIDTEKYPAIASAHKIQALPTLVLFKGGKPVDRIEGLPQEQQLVDRVSYFLNN